MQKPSNDCYLQTVAISTLTFTQYKEKGVLGHRFSPDACSMFINLKHKLTAKLNCYRNTLEICWTDFFFFMMTFRMAFTFLLLFDCFFFIFHFASTDGINFASFLMRFHQFVCMTNYYVLQKFTSALNCMQFDWFLCSSNGFFSNSKCIDYNHFWWTMMCTVILSNLVCVHLWGFWIF